MKTALKWGAIIALVLLVVAFLYAMVLLVLPATMFGMSLPFKVPDSVGVNPYLGRAITLTFGFLAAVLIIKYMIGWWWFQRKILAFAGIVAVFVVWNLFMWWTITAQPRAKMSDLRQQNNAQQTAIAQCEDKTKELRARVGKAEAAKTSCDGRIAQFQQALPAKEQMLVSKAQENEALVAAATQRKQEVEALRRQLGECSDLRQQNKAQQVQVVQLKEESAKLRSTVSDLEGAKTSCDGRIAQFQQALPAKEQMLVSKAQENEALVAAATQRKQEVEALRRQLGECTVSADDQPAPTAFTASNQPAVYPPPSASSSPPKPKAKIVITKEHYDHMSFSGGKFFVELVEKNGVDVVFDRMMISIWQRASRTQPINEVKQDKPAVFERSGFELVIKGGSGNPTKIGKTLEQYQEWLNGDEWVELTLFGTDANGHSHTLTFAGAD